jgi:hypothetical protein
MFTEENGVAPGAKIAFFDIGFSLTKSRDEGKRGLQITQSITSINADDVISRREHSLFQHHKNEASIPQLPLYSSRDTRMLKRENIYSEVTLHSTYGGKGKRHARE